MVEELSVRRAEPAVLAELEAEGELEAEPEIP